MPKLPCRREGASYFVTFRLADSLPQSVWFQFLAEKSHRLAALNKTNGCKGSQPVRVPTPLEAATETVEIIERDYYRKIERYLDRGFGACHLRRPDIAAMVIEALRHFDQHQYLLDDWVVMPNHVHLILWPVPNFTLSEILKSRKQFTATQANRMLGRTGQPFWQSESFDHWIRDEAQKARIRRYIRANPVKAGLCSSPESWPWSCAWRGGCGSRR